MGQMQPLTITKGVEIVRSAGGSIAVDDFVANYRQHHAPSNARTLVVDVLCRLINAGHLVLDDGVVSLPDDADEH